MCILGTSTFDGMAIAQATLKYFIQDVKSFTLSVSHYPISKEFNIYPTCRNYHMTFITDRNQDNNEKVCNRRDDSIVFLYKLKEGCAKKSYGLNVARMARIQPIIIERAFLKSIEMEDSVRMLR